VKIISLSGKSGTGKSYNAIEICNRMNIPALIDDGLFIFENSVAAGISAKKQTTKVGAIKTALFTDDQHRDNVQEKILEKHPSSILVIGTSDEMVNRICSRLGLPQPEQYIHIQDILSDEQMAKAHELREKSGMHTIPAPTFELKKQFSGYFLDATRAFRSRFGGTKDDEKTIVRPTYSYLGSYEVSDKVIQDIAEHIISKTDGAASLLWSAGSKTEEGMIIRVIILCEWGARVKEVARKVQRDIYTAVEQTTAYNVLGVEVEVRGFKGNSEDFVTSWKRALKSRILC